jgi:hypothetical protein
MTTSAGSSLEHSQVRAAVGVANAEEMSPLVHGEGEQPADLSDHRSFTFLLQCGLLSLFCF